MIHRVLAAAVGLCLLSFPAVAQPRCQNYHTLLAEALQRYGEVPVSMGLSRHGHTVLTLANRQSGSWTVVVRRPDGCALVVDHGEAWSAIDAPDEGVSL